MATVKENLIAAKALIADEINWVKGGYRVELPSGTLCFCSAGAIKEVIGLPPAFLHDTAECLELEKHVPGAMTIVGFNDLDATTHSDIMALFDRAIAAQDGAA